MHWISDQQNNVWLRNEVYEQLILRYPENNWTISLKILHCSRFGGLCPLKKIKNPHTNGRNVSFRFWKIYNVAHRCLSTKWRNVLNGFQLKNDRHSIFADGLYQWTCKVSHILNPLSIWKPDAVRPSVSFQSLWLEQKSTALTTFFRSSGGMGAAQRSFGRSLSWDLRRSQTRVRMADKFTVLA
jgi:hypothetical protein